MKRLMLMCMSVAVLLSLPLAGCAGSSRTPTPPVKTLIDLDKLVAVNMTVDQVYTLMTPDLKSTSVFYQAQNIELVASGNWKIVSKDGGYKADETGPYQALFFTPTKAGIQYYVVFFKDNIVMAKAWFTAQFGVVVEALLQGKSLVK